MISAVVHTYNEEKNIERCLSSLSWVDEIVLVDMGSTDQTTKLSSHFKTKIYQHPYTGFVEPARNYGLSKAQGEWIFVIDADEVITQSLANYLKLEVNKPSFDFYRIARKNIIFGKWMRHTGWWPDYQIRLFKKGMVTWTEKIHGVPLTRGKGTDIESCERLSITHYNYQSLEQYISRMNRYTSISAKELFVANKHCSPRILFEAPIHEFINRYFVAEGYKDGFHGLSLSLLQSFSELVTYLKLWELSGFKEEKITLREVENLLTVVHKRNQYWLNNELLKQVHYFWDDIIWRIKRKFSTYG